jgi:cation:H+ antiporter
MVGIGWPLVVLLAWFKGRKSSTRHVELGRGETSEVVFLALATIYAFTIPLKYAIFDGAGLSLWDTLVFIGLFALYMRSCSKCTRIEPELGGPAATITALPRKISWAAIGSLFLFPAAVILASAQPFADGLLVAGREAGIDEFIMVQWVAPLASESPELLVAAIFVLKANSSAALRMLMSSKVNQWTLLVGMLPLVYSISLGSSGTLPLDGRQMEEILLTAAQSALALAFVIRLRLSAGSVLILLLLFTSQLFLTEEWIRYSYSGVYLGLTVLVFTRDRGRVRSLWVITKDTLGATFNRNLH